MMPSLVTGDNSNLVDDKTFESLLIETFTPQTVTETTDGQGGYTKAWANGTDFEGRLSKLSVSERMAQDKETAIATHKIYCLTAVDADPDDQIILGSRTFVVVGVQRPSNLTTNGHLEILVREIDYDL